MATGVFVGSTFGALVGSSIGDRDGTFVGSGPLVGSATGANYGIEVPGPMLGAGVSNTVGVAVAPFITHSSASAMTSQVPEQFDPPLKQRASGSSLKSRGPGGRHPIVSS